MESVAASCRSAGSRPSLRRRRVAVVAIVHGLAAYLGALAAAHAQTPASPPAGTPAPLPKLEVEAPKAKAKAKQAKQQKAGPAVAAPSETQPTAAPPVAETGSSPVKGYIAGVTGTGIKTDTPLTQIPQSVSVVTTDVVTDQGAKTVQESVRYVPGVFADAYGPDSRGDYPRVRGSDPNIYLDGTRFVNTWKFNESRPDPFTLSRIEVLRGPASVLYGDTSTAGILNLVSKLPQEQAAGEIGVQYGSFNRKQLQMDMTGKLTSDGQLLYRFIGVLRDSDYQTDYVKDDRLVIAPSLTWKPSIWTTWTVLGLYQDDKTGSSTAFLPIEGTLYPGPNGRIPVSRFASDPSFDLYRTKTASVSSLFEHKFSDSFQVRENVRYTHTDGTYNTLYPNNYSNPNPANMDFPYLDATHRTVERYSSSMNPIRDAVTSDTNAELKFATGPVEHKLLVGFDYRRLREHGTWGFGYETTPFDLYNPVYNPITPPELTPFPTVVQSQSGLYAQDQIKLGPWIVVAGVRRDWVTSDEEGSALQTDQATTYRLGLMYELPFGLTPYISYARSFNPIFGAQVCLSYCKPTLGEQVEVGFKYKPSKSLVVNGALFDVVEQNRLAASNDPNYSIQTGEVRIRGAELEMIASVTSTLDVIGAYSYVDAMVTKGDTAGNHVETVPLHQASLWVKHKFSLFGLTGFSAGAGVRYIGESWGGVDTLKVPDYALFDAMAAYETGTWKLQINGTNLQDREHVTTCLTRGDCFYGARRTILSTLTYKF